METVIIQAICDSGRCFACGGLVYAVEKQRTTKHVYHDRCFRCRVCKRNLNGASLNEEADDIYCTNCYRKKLRGECHDPNFQRAALEKAQYVYTEHHPDLKLIQNNTRPKLIHQPSLLLRKIERKYLSAQEDSKEKKTSPPPVTPAVSSSAPPASVSHPFKVRAVFQVPIALGRFRLNHHTSKETVPSPPLHFSPVISPKTNPLSRATTPLTDQFLSTPKTIRRFIFNSNAPIDRTTTLDLHRRGSLPITRQISTTFDVSGQKREKRRKFSTPDLGRRFGGSRRSLDEIPNRLSTIRELS